MVVYFDTSYLAKIYLLEPGTELAREIQASVGDKATSPITYVEMAAALSRQRRDGALSDNEYHRLLTEFRSDWPKLVKIEINEELVRHAGDLASKYALKGADAIHLASALEFSKAGKGIKVLFATADEKLRRGAVLEGLVTPGDYHHEGGKPGMVGEKKRKWGKDRRKR